MSSSGPPVLSADDPPASVAAPRWLLGLLVLTLTTSVSLSVGTRQTPLGFVAGTADGWEWFSAGENIALFGVLGKGYEPWLHRPPGYPLWVAAILKIAVDPAKNSEAMVSLRGPVALGIMDSVLLGLCSLLLFAWLARRLRPASAFAAALVLGANPYSLVTATLVRYDMLQWVVILAAILFLDTLFTRSGKDAFGLFLAGGALLGVATLVRPVTLLVPIFFLPLFFWQGFSRRATFRYLFFAGGMMLTILPWTARNMAISGRVIPTNVQGWTQVFASTPEVGQHDPDRYEWWRLTTRHYLPLYARVTGEPTYKFETYAKNILALEDAAREAALRNIAAKPGVYASNIMRQTASLTLDINAVLLTVFTRLQTGDPFDPRWIFLGESRALQRGPEAHAFQRLHDLLLLAAVAGLVLAFRRRDFFLAPAAALWVAILCVYVISYLDFFYYSVKVPFLVAFAFYAIDALPRAFRFGFTMGLSALSLGLSWSMRLLG